MICTELLDLPDILNYLLRIFLISTLTFVFFISFGISGTASKDTFRLSSFYRWLKLGLSNVWTYYDVSKVIYLIDSFGDIINYYYYELGEIIKMLLSKCCCIISVSSPDSERMLDRLWLS